MGDTRSSGLISASSDEGTPIGPFEAASVVLVVFLAGLIPAVAVPVVGLRVGAAITGLMALLLGFVVPRRAVPTLALALIPASLVVSSQLVPLDGRYFPFAAVAGALLIAVVRLARQGGLRFRVPAAPILLALVAYVAWTAVTSVTSIDRPTSLIYVVGVVGTLALAFVLVPTVVEKLGTRWFLGTLAAVAIALAISSIVLIITGPVVLFGQYVGLYLVAEITIAGAPTSILVPRAMGPYPVPADVGLALAVGLVALLALRSGMTHRAKRVNAGLIVLLVIGLLLTMARSGWLLAAAAPGCLVVLRRWQGRWDRAALLVTALFAAAFLLLSANVLGAVLRPDVAAGRYGPQIAQLLPGTDTEGVVQFRGGTDLSGRPLIWAASVQALRASPIVGYGPGTNPQAIEPYLTGSGARFRGLTSHNTWLRTAVEMGLPGLAAFLVFAAGSAVIVLRRLRSERSNEHDPLAAALAAIAVGVVGWQAFESLILGGLSYPGFIWVASIGLLVAIPATTGRRGERSERALVD